ncbi:MAG: sulfatase-like hydrolase/transferase [Candidatus Cloacimonetes bacterium]|nr:sulfatase-like hydrolase/transferase [Candidatus Cloacimonadota bacterium]
MKSINLFPMLGVCCSPLILTTGCNEQQQSQQQENPNIIFILADDLGYGDLGCYGNEQILTPTLDSLAATGTRFTQAYAGSAVSSPSRCALMTGKNSGNTTIRDNFAAAGGLEGLKNGNPIRRMHLLPTDTTIATILKSAGYKTCLVNKWHLDGFNPEATPLNRGFDEFYGWLVSTTHSNDPYYYPYYRFNNDSLVHIEENAEGRHLRHNTDISTDEAIQFIRRNSNDPFFLYLAYDSPHEPFIIDDTSWYDSKDWDLNTKRYAALITHMDQSIGRLIAEVENLGILDNTLIIFASDNGAAIQAPLEVLKSNGNLRGRKALLYEGGIRIPFIVNQKGKVPVQTLDNQIYFPDILPTLANLVDATVPEKLNGINILPLFYGMEVETDNRMLYWEFPGKQYAARKGDWKVVSTQKDTPLELYNLKEDCSESINLADEHPDVVEELKKEMSEIRSPSPNWPLPEEE